MLINAIVAQLKRKHLFLFQVRHSRRLEKIPPSRRRGMRSLTRSRDRLFCCLPPLLVIPSRNPRFLSQVAVVNYTSRTMSENDVSGQGAREGMLDMLLVYVMEHNQITSLLSTVAA